MADAKKVTVIPEVAERLGAPIEQAQRETERRDMLRRVSELEYSLTKTSDALRLIARGLGDMAEEHAARDVSGLSDYDISLLCGAVNLLDCVAADCDRAYRGETMARTRL